jgi:CheY-like chemotaxis protein
MRTTLNHSRKHKQSAVITLDAFGDGNAYSSTESVLMAYTVLCVDDNPTIRDFYAAMFSSHGHRPIIVEGGPQALTMLEEAQARIDAVVVDYSMPQMNGLELAAEIKRRSPDLPVIMVSSDVSVVESAPQHVDVALEKGSNLRLLLSHIDQLVSARNPKENRASA